MRNPTKLGLAAFVASLACTSMTPAQTQPGGGKPVIGVAAGDVRNNPLLTIDFPGGTVSQYVNALKNAASTAGVAVNIIVPADAAKVEMPAISLQSVRAATALNALETAFRRNSEHQFKVEEFSQDTGESPSFAISYMRIESNRVTGGPSMARIEIFSVRDILDSSSSEAAEASKGDILRTLDAALKMQGKGGGEEEPSVMYHGDSNLLIVRGTPAVIEVVRSVLARVRDDVVSRKRQSADQTQWEAMKARRVQMAKNRVDLMKMELGITNERLDRAMQSKEAGATSAGDLAELRLMRARSEFAVKQAEAEVEDAEMTMAPTGVGAGAASGAIDTGEAADTETYRLKHIDATTAGQVATSILAYQAVGNERVAIDSMQNSIIVMARKGRQDLVRTVITTMDEAVGKAVDARSGAKRK